jgi:hypothetical protein
MEFFLKMLVGWLRAGRIQGAPQGMNQHNRPAVILRMAYVQYGTGRQHYP